MTDGWVAVSIRNYSKSPEYFESEFDVDTSDLLAKNIKGENYIYCWKNFTAKSGRMADAISLTGSVLITLVQRWYDAQCR